MNTWWQRRMLRQRWKAYAARMVWSRDDLPLCDAPRRDTPAQRRRGLRFVWASRRRAAATKESTAIDA